MPVLQQGVLTAPHMRASTALQTAAARAQEFGTDHGGRQALEKLLSTLVHTVADQLDGGKSSGAGLELRLNKTKVTNFFKNCGGATSKKAG